MRSGGPNGAARSHPPNDVETLKAMVLAMAEKTARADALESAVADLKACNADARIEADADPEGLRSVRPTIGNARGQARLRARDHGRPHLQRGQEARAIWSRQ